MRKLNFIFLTGNCCIYWVLLTYAAFLALVKAYEKVFLWRLLRSVFIAVKIAL